MLRVTVTQRRKALLVPLLFVAGVITAQEAPMASPPLTLNSGAILSVRINEPLSSDRNRAGDAFSARLTQPVVVLGIVVARYGQTVAGRVLEAKKAGKVSGVSRLGLTLTRLTLVDGQTVPINSQLLVQQGPTSVGRDAAAVAGTTGLGAAIGAAAGGGSGAAIGAGIGAAAGALGVLLTRGYPTVIHPESLLTFQVTAPVTIETNNAPQAFRFVEPADYASEQTPSQFMAAHPVPPVYPAPPAYPYPYYGYYAPPFYPYYYPYYGYPYFYGPSFTLFFGFPYYHYHTLYRYRGHYGFAPIPVPHGGMVANTFHSSAHH
jgi:hypothetical protein